MSLTFQFSQVPKRVRQRIPFFSVILAVASVLHFSGCVANEGSVGAKPFVGISILAGHARELGEPFGLAYFDGSLYISDGDGGRVLRLAATGESSVFASGLDTPSGIAFDADGSLIVADAGSNSITKIDPTGAVSVIAGSGARGFADGNAVSASFSSPVGIAVAQNGAIYVADTYNDRIRVIENGIVRTAAGGERGFADGSGGNARFDTPLGLAAWHDKILVADAGNLRIRVIEPDGRVWTLAGDGTEERIDGTLSASAFTDPTAIAVSPGGSIYIADGDSIRVIGDGAFPFVETLVARRGSERAGRLFESALSRPSGITVDDAGSVFVTDSDNGVIRKLARADTSGNPNAETTGNEVRLDTAEEFRKAAAARWPYDPPTAPRDVAGTLGEIRGHVDEKGSNVWFHNGLDIAGAYGEPATFIRDEKVLDPMAAENFGTLRELLRLPTLGYIHIRLGRDRSDTPFGDGRFLFDRAPGGKVSDVRVPRGSRFRAGEVIGTLNALNHVHLIAGRRGAEMNALSALELPGVTDSIAPTIENVAIFDRDRPDLETKSTGSRITISGPIRLVVRAFDRMDGNPERRKLGVYKLGYSVIPVGEAAPAEPNWTIVFDRMPPNDAVRTVYADGSNSGPYGGTVFNYIVTNRLNGDSFSEGFIDAATLAAGAHTIRVYAADLFGNTTTKDIHVEVVK